jgi:hypothetical protein
MKPRRGGKSFFELHITEMGRGQTIESMPQFCLTKQAWREQEEEPKEYNPRPRGHIGYRLETNARD